jgi:hypothetical protein
MRLLNSKEIPSIGTGDKPCRAYFQYARQGLQNINPAHPHEKNSARRQTISPI